MFTPIDTITLADGVTLKLHREMPNFVAQMIDQERDRLGIGEGNPGTAFDHLDLLRYGVAVGALDVESDHHTIEWPPLPVTADPLTAHEIITARRAVVCHMPPAMLRAAFDAIAERMGLKGDEGNGSGEPSEASGGSETTPPA